MTVDTLWGQVGAGAFQNDPTPYTIGVQFSVSQACTLTGTWFDSPAGAVVLPQTIALYQVTGAGTGTLVSSQSASWSGAAASGWVRAAWTSPPSLSPGVSYKACVLQDTAAGWYGATNHYWDTGAGSNGITSGVLSAPNSAGGDQGQDTFHFASTLTYPDTTNLARNYWVDPEVTASAGVNPAWWWDDDRRMRM